MKRIVSLGVLGRKTIPIPTPLVGGIVNKSHYGTVYINGSPALPGQVLKENDSLLFEPLLDGGAAYLYVEVVDAQEDLDIFTYETVSQPTQEIEAGLRPRTISLPM